MKYQLAASRFFSEEEKKKIEETARDVESRTIGEIVVAVTESSDPYAEADALGGILLGSLLSFALAALFFHSSIWFFVPMSFIFYVLFQWIVRRVTPLRAVLISRERKAGAVRRMAVHAFYEHGLYRTKMNTGVLFFFSLLERKVWVLADTGIHQKIGQDALNRFAALVSQGVREGRSCDALCEAIRDMGKLLAIHFPMTPGDINELPDAIIAS